jgi:hypothetical protein
MRGPSLTEIQDRRPWNRPPRAPTASGEENDMVYILLWLLGLPLGLIIILFLLGIGR